MYSARKELIVNEKTVSGDAFFSSDLRGPVLKNGGSMLAAVQSI